MFIESSTAGRAGESLGRIAFPLIIIAIGVYFSNRLGKQRGTGFVWWPTIVAVALVAISIYGQRHG